MNRHQLEEHRFSFEGSTSLMARHLVDDHGVPATTVKRWANGLDQGSWVALDDLHQEAHAADGRAEKHDYEPDHEQGPGPMHTDRPCRICGQARRVCEE